MNEDREAQAQPRALPQGLIEAAFTDRALLKDTAVREAVLAAVAALDNGELRAAQKREGRWEANAWVKQAILLYFALMKPEPSEAGPLSFRDLIPVKRGLEAAGVRVVPPGTVRYGAFLEPGAIVMPAYVNIGARVGRGSMVDTWATVGSCAQIGGGVHLSGGVGIGGVLEPPSATPVVVEDGCFIGSRCILVEGVCIEEGAVLGANVTITASTPIIDVRGPAEIVLKGRVPARSVVIPGVRPRRFPAGDYGVPCALIIGERSASTDRKTSLNDVLREFELPV